MEVIGYKCFNKDLTNNYGMSFRVGETYSVSGNVSFGTKGNGFHMCSRLEDTLRYFDAMKKEVSICLVKGSGQIEESSDEYYGYYDMYCTEKIEILKELSRSEIIEMALTFAEERLNRFISCYKLTTRELAYFKDKFGSSPNILCYIEYYQEGNLEVFKKRVKK